MILQRLSILLVISFLFLNCKPKNKNTENQQAKRLPAACAPQVTDEAWYSSGKAAPLFENLGETHFKISTADTLAQQYFDQGLTLTYGFNHAEAARSFYYASQLDPNCAMAYWGYAFVKGPNYNEAMEDENYPKTHNAVQKALKLLNGCTLKERTLIEALAQRYSSDPVSDRSELDQSYAMAMAQVLQLFPNDAHIATLYAEALMNLHPWDLYSKDGEAKPWTAEIVAVLKHALELDPNNLGAHHYMIHAVEASAAPEDGYVSAARFDRGLAPGLGHLIHMPSHIYIRTGDYYQGTLANIRAIQVDSAYVGACNAQGTYPLALYPHNYHFLVATATLGGNKRWAVKAAERIEQEISPEIMQLPDWSTLQHYATIPYNVYVKFGMWDKILSKENEIKLPYTDGVRHYARGMAYAAKNKISKAKTELEHLKQIAQQGALKTLTIWDINSMHDLLLISSKVLEAEINNQEGDWKTAVVLLNEAIEIEDALNYNEPPDWFFSVRQRLGNILLQNNQPKQAVTAYQQDLSVYPKNGWSLSGLKRAYELMDMQDKALQAQERFKKAWAHADITLDGSIINLD